MSEEWDFTAISELLGHIDTIPDKLETISGDLRRIHSAIQLVADILSELVPDRR